MVTKYFEVPFANSGDKVTIPDASQPSGAVSFTDGYTPDYEKDQLTDPDAKDVSRTSENYFKFTVTEALKEIQEQGFKPYDALVNYPVGAIIPGSDHVLYTCLIANGPASSVVDPVADITGTWIRKNITLSDYNCNLETAITAIGAVNETHLIVDCKPADLTGALVQTKNITIEWRTGNTLGGAFTFTINGPLIAGVYQLFETNLTVVFGQGSIQHAKPEWRGAAADDATDSGAAINAMLEACNDAHIPVIGLAGTYIIEETIIIKNLMSFICAGFDKTYLKLKNGVDVDIVKTYDFDNLTGQNKWNIEDGVVHGFKLWGFTVDGNKANNASGSGVLIYGKGYIAGEIKTYNCSEKGFYSEAGAGTGQVDDHLDMPEAQVGPIWLRGNEGVGFHYRGPHDGHISYVASSNGQAGSTGEESVRIESSANYGGSCDIGKIHAYGSGSGYPAAYINAPVRADEFIGESGWTNGVHIVGDNSQFGILQAYLNNKDLGNNFGILIQGDNNSVGSLRITDNNDGGGISVPGDGNVIAGGTISGDNSSTKSGLKIEGNDNQFNLNVRAYQGVNGTGMKTIGGKGNIVNLNTKGCEIGWDNDTAGERNIYNITIRNETAGKIGFQGAAPDVNESELWNVVQQIGSVYKYSKRSWSPSGTIDLNITTVQSFTFSHGLIDTPSVSKISLSISAEGVTTGSTMNVDYMMVTAVTATQITVKLKMGAAFGSAETALLNVRASL